MSYTANILMVDDHPENLITLEAVLDCPDVNLIAAHSGNEALKIAFSTELALILLDVQMPEMDGFEVAKLLGEMPKTRNIPIIFVTAISKEQRHVHQGYTFGAVDYLFKPIDPHILNSKVRIFLELDKQKAQLDQLNRDQTKLIGQLRKVDQSLSYAQKVARMGNWTMNLKTKEFTVSDELPRLLQLDEAQPVKLEHILGFIPVEEREQVIQEVERSVKEAKGYNMEHQIKLADGSIRQVQHVSMPFHDGDSDTLIGIIQDITEIKEAEDQLGIAQKLFEQAIEGVFITDTDGVIVSGNPSVTTITGYTANEFLGKSPSIFKSERHSQGFYEEMWEAVKVKGQWSGEIWNRRKNGDTYPEWLSISAILNKEGQRTNYIAIFHDISDIKQSEEKLSYQAHHDALTDLPNRSLFFDRLEMDLNAAKREGKQLAVIYADLDNFKYTNDSLGHYTGDLLLQEVAQRMLSCLRDEDTVARLGGDEFAFILRHIDSVYQVQEVCERIHRSLSEPVSIKGQDVHTGVSLGISLYPSDSENMLDLVKDADLAMYKAKRSGKNQFAFFTNALNEKAQKRMELESSLRQAVENQEFEVYYQAKVTGDTHSITGMEALIRWNHPQKGLVSPVDFIPIAEETGVIIEIGQWVLQQACEDTKILLDSGFDLKVAVNLSPRQFGLKGLREDIEMALESSGLPAKNLELEITESMVMGDTDKAIQTMEELKQLGCSLSMDDFGTGYSSLSYLKKFPLDSLKIDQAFVFNLTSDISDQKIVHATIQLAHGLNLKVVAEGVENLESAEMLKELGAEYLQGYHFSKPIPFKDFQEYIK